MRCDNIAQHSYQYSWTVAISVTSECHQNTHNSTCHAIHVNRTKWNNERTNERSSNSTTSTNSNNNNHNTTNRKREIEHTRSQHFGGLFNRCFPIDARVGCQPPEKNIFNFRQKSVFYALICCLHKIQLFNFLWSFACVFSRYRCSCVIFSFGWYSVYKILFFTFFDCSCFIFT